MVVEIGCYQSLNEVVISLFDKDIAGGAPVVDCQPRHLRVSVNDRVLLDTSLYDEVVCEKHRVKFAAKKMELTLPKRNPKSWPKLEDAQTDKRTTVYGDKWSQQIQEVENDEENTGDDMQAYFKKIYKTADDDTRKAMNKSWSESNGTVFNTNWKEVSSKKVEPKDEDTFEVRM